MKAAATIDGIRRMVRVGRDGKNRYCIYHYWYNVRVPRMMAIQRRVLAGGLTKKAAYGMLKLLKEK